MECKYKKSGKALCTIYLRESNRDRAKLVDDLGLRRGYIAGHL
jgi:ATP-dependent Clp protease adapter protein ClpS